MAKYKCLISGNVIEFTNQVDIDSMVGHEGYIKLDEEAQQEAVKEVMKTSTKKAKTATEVTE